MSRPMFMSCVFFGNCYHNVIITKSVRTSDAYKRCECQSERSLSMRLVVALNVMANYNNSQIVDILITFGECGKNAAETARVLNERYPDRHRHNVRSILRIISRARQFICVVEFKVKTLNIYCEEQKYRSYI
ncbi:hypothetical protein DMN91_002316 [Ooceraea biroi]|uniref:DUF4817 domain-containing protein n=1 Tax=Ooceraea biroi TaxID=2015173 RepID=A0A3L8E0B2_OOCBI|nr:hypothetical protein DMN91_002316 [Ooceraea biroi]